MLRACAVAAARPWCPSSLLAVAADRHLGLHAAQFPACIHRVGAGHRCAVGGDHQLAVRSLVGDRADRRCPGRAYADRTRASLDRDRLRDPSRSFGAAAPGHTQRPGCIGPLKKTRRPAVLPAGRMSHRRDSDPHTSPPRGPRPAGDRSGSGSFGAAVRPGAVNIARSCRERYRPTSCPSSPGDPSMPEIAPFLTMCPMTLHQGLSLRGHRHAPHCENFLTGSCLVRRRMRYPRFPATSSPAGTPCWSRSGANGCERSANIRKPLDRRPGLNMIPPWRVLRAPRDDP